ncbi:DUF4352 domain-containing protein [Antrihabitans stalactiti]|uniref:DUF4352 domain-containing protein n=1 Tax=Antrihabitans stalactiti TaxID=2584121 RepID=A0A848KND8_9NOCA|nr:DUF4352 domain-containing protein [Antrihabitans stalactiti]NMN97820.1 DUF4352 domain-containing protein [Antrihabitans stalactiti]
MSHPQMPYPPHYPPVAPPAPKKNWFARHKVLTVLAFLLLIIVIAVASGGGEKAGDDSGPGAQAKPKPGIGVPVRDGKFEFVVQSVEAGVASVGASYATESAQGQFVLVKLSVRNVGDREQSFSMSAQKLLDGGGRQYSVDDMATITLDKGTVYEQINPGNSVDATIVFDVPAGTIPSQIELHDSVFSGGTTVALK